MLQEAIGEAAGRSAQVNGGDARDRQSEVAQPVFEFGAAAAHVALDSGQGQLVSGGDRVAGLAGQLSAHANLAGEDGAFGRLTAGAEAALDEGLVEPREWHGARP